MDSGLAPEARPGMTVKCPSRTKMAGTSPAMTCHVGEFTLALDHDPRADLGAAVEVHHVFVGHADAARGHRLADGLRLVGAVDAVDRAADIEGAGAERIVRGALHVARQVRA